MGCSRPAVWRCSNGLQQFPFSAGNSQSQLTASFHRRAPQRPPFAVELSMAHREVNFASRIHFLSCAPLMAAAADFHRSVLVPSSTIPTSTSPEFIRTATTRPACVGSGFEAQSVLMAVAGVGLLEKADSSDGTLTSLSIATAAARFEMICMRDLLMANPDTRGAFKDLQENPAAK